MTNEYWEDEQRLRNEDERRVEERRPHRERASSLRLERITEDEQQIQERRRTNFGFGY